MHAKFTTMKSVGHGAWGTLRNGFTKHWPVRGCPTTRILTRIELRVSKKAENEKSNISSLDGGG